MLKRISTVACVAVAVLLVAPVRAEIIEQVLVKVNGDILTKTEFEQRQVAMLRSRPELANVSPESEALQQAVAQVTPQLILEAVDELLLVQRGRELGLTLGDEQFKSIIDNIKKQNNLEDEERFQAALKQEGMSMTDLRRNLERQMFVSQVQQRDIADKISVTEEESRAYYDLHRTQFTTPAQVTLREILVEVPAAEKGINVAQDDEAKAKAEAIRQRLIAGEPFAKLAADVSDAPSKANGGLIGPVSHEELAAALQALVDKMKVGELTEVIRTPRGYQILKLETRTETQIRTFEEARDDLGNKVGEEKIVGERLKYLDKLRTQATITFRNDELKKAYDQALAARQKAQVG